MASNNLTYQIFIRLLSYTSFGEGKNRSYQHAEQIKQSVHKQLTAEVYPYGVSAAEGDGANPLFVDGGKERLSLPVQKLAQKRTHQKPAECGEKGQIVAAVEVGKGGYLLTVVHCKEKPQGVVVSPRFGIGACAHYYDGKRHRRHHNAEKVFLPPLDALFPHPFHRRVQRDGQRNDVNDVEIYSDVGANYRLDRKSVV